MIMSRVRYRLEIWDRANSTRLAYAATVSELRRHRVLKGEETLAARITLHDYAAGRLQRGCVLRVQRVGEPQVFTLWRVTSVERSRTADGALACEISADALWTDLRHGRVRQLMADGRALYTWGLIDVAPEEWIRDVILPGYAGTGVTFELGVVELTAPVSLSFDRTSPLEALRMLEQACTEAEGGAELQFRPNALGTGYLVDLLRRVGQTDGGAELRYRKNIQALSRREDESAIATRVYAAGSGMLTLADAEWEIAAVGGTAAARVLSFKAAHPVFESGAFVGLWFYAPGKAAYPITASDASAGTLTVDGAGRPALATGDVGWIATDQAGARLDYLESPAGVADYGVRVGDLVADDVPDALNLLPNGDFSDWANGLPVGWSAAGAPTIEESIDHAQRGRKSAHVTA
ncbi:MAG TPA: phage tail protein, partial [Nannocystis sp.]